jgi:hypothetical protein
MLLMILNINNFTYQPHLVIPAFAGMTDFKLVVSFILRRGEQIASAAQYQSAA